MKITILGTGCIWTKRACASYLINDDIILDPGSGTLKQLFQSTNKVLHHEKIEKIKLILVTHYHSDHYFDILYFMWKLASDKNPNTRATIICPPGGEEKIKLLCSLGMSKPTFEKLNFDKYIKFVDASKMGTYLYGNLEITSHKMEHGQTECYGYTFKEAGGKTVSFTGDSNFCESMQYMIDNSQVAFVDMAGTDVSSKHFNIIDGIKLMQEYRGKCNIIPCHLTSQALDYCIGRINPPKDLMVIDTNHVVPYEYQLNENSEQKSEEYEIELATDKFDKIEGEIIDLKLSSKKAQNKLPTYCFDISLHSTGEIIGELSYSVVPETFEGHDYNVYFKLNKDYASMKSIKYESCMLIKQVAEYHNADILYLVCPPDDFDTRKVYENLGAYLKEIKTSTFVDETNTRKTQENGVWVWEF